MPPHGLVDAASFQPVSNVARRSGRRLVFDFPTEIA
jgi:hypothetical protein